MIAPLPNETPYRVTHRVTSSGDRLDQFLKRRMSGCSREILQSIIGEGRVLIHRQGSSFAPVGRLKPSSQLLAGDEVEVITYRTSRPEPEVRFDYKIAYEDDDLLVVDKPGNLPVHPAGSFLFHTLLTHLRNHRPLPEGSSYHLVHRLDRETSGLIALCKKADLCSILVNQFSERTTEKEYLAIVHRWPLADVWINDAPMARTTQGRIELKMQVTPISMGGQLAQTEFAVLGRKKAEFGNVSLLRCTPRTGRQHQIRLHLEHSGHPLVGDKVYGLPEKEALKFLERDPKNPPPELPLSRHALHAARLALDHPRTGKRIELATALAPDLLQFWDTLG